MDETRARFLAAIAKQLPAERIAEAHLFAAIRQGGVESGVAVIALEPEQEETAPDISAEHLAADATGVPAADAVIDAADVNETLGTADADTGDAEPREALGAQDEPASPTVDTVDVDRVERASDGDEDSPYAALADAEPPVAVAPAPARRYVVCTARYRHTLKGPDRGKWEVTVMEEADAPLLAVDAVVRGVQRRSGDVDEIVRLSGEELRAALPVPATS